MKHVERQSDSGPIAPIPDNADPQRPPYMREPLATVVGSLYRVAPWLRRALRIARRRALVATRRAGHYARAALLGRVGTAVVAAALALVVVISAVVAYSSVQTVRDHDYLVNHSNAVLAQMGAVSSALDNAVAGVRGYVITGDTSYLQPYERAKGNLTPEVSRLQALALDNAQQEALVRNVRSRITSEMSYLQEIVGLRQANQTGQAANQVTSGTGKSTLDGIHALIAKMTTTENTLLHSRDASAAAALRATKVTIALAVLLDLALLCAVIWLLRKAMALRAQVTAERLRAETEMRMLALEQTNQRMNEFLSVAGHELRTPITSVQASVDMIERQLKHMSVALASAEERQRARLDELLSRARRQLHRQDRLVTDLLEFSRIQTAKLELRPSRCDLERIVRETVNDQRALDAKRAITFDSPAERAPIWVMADADRIGQVITNYLTNALKYSPAEAPVIVSLETCPSGARVAVRDQGPGLPPEEHQHIWERFQRAEGVEVLSGTGVGLGLGLYLSKTIIERHDGAVGVESVPGQGATFWFTLPLASDDAPPTAQSVESSDHHNL